VVEVTDAGITFTWKDYGDDACIKLMTLAPFEFIRRFLLHVLPDGFQRIRHYGFLANGNRQAKLTRIRELLPPAPQPQQQVVPASQEGATPTLEPEDLAACTTEDDWQPTCPECGGVMVIVKTLARVPRHSAPRIDTS
jgi:hypothetical protein